MGILCLAASVGRAQTYWTDSTGGTTSWINNSNWNPAAFPNGVSANARLTNNILGDQTITLDQAITNSILFIGDADGGSAFTLATGTGGSFVLTNATWTQLTGAGSVTVSAPINLLTSLAFTNAASTLFTISGPVSGAGGLTKRGAGTLTLTGTNTFSGVTTISAGQLVMANFAALTNSTVTINVSGGLVFSNGTAFTLGGLSGATGSSNLGLTNTAGTAITLTVGNNNSNTFFGGVLSGTGGALIKVGSGYLALTNANTYTGDTTVNGGVLRAGLGVGLPTAGNLNLNNGAWETGVNINQTLGTGAGQVQLNNGGSAGFSANGAAISVTLNGGAPLTWGSGNFNPSAFVLNAASANTNLTFVNSIDFNSGIRTIEVDAAVATITGTLSDGSLVKRGGGVLVLSSINTYAGNTLVTGGVLRADLGVGLPTTGNLNLNNGVWETSLNINQTLGTGAGQVQLNAGGSAGFSAFGTDISVVLNSGGALTWGSGNFNPGTLVLNSSTATGNLTFSNNIALGSVNRAINVIAKTATLTGNITGTGSITVGGSGTLVFAGNSTFTGGLMLNGGAKVTATTTNGFGTGIISTANNASITVGLLNDGSGNNGTITYKNGIQLNTGQGASAGVTLNIGALTTASGNTVVLSNTFTTAGDGNLSFTINSANNYNLEIDGTFTQGAANYGTLRPMVVSMTGGNLILGSNVLYNGGGGGTSGQINFNLSGTGNIIRGRITNAIFATQTLFITKGSGGIIDLQGLTSSNVILQANGGAIRLDNANAAPGGLGVTGGTGNLQMSGGIFELTAASGDLTRGLGTGIAQIQFASYITSTGLLTPGSGGFGAIGGNRIVNLGGASAPLIWGSTPSFIASGQTMIFNSVQSDSQTDFQNPINFNGAVRVVNVVDNPNSSADQALLSGALSGTGASGLNKIGAGKLILSANNSYSGVTTINAGSLWVSGSIGTGAVTVAPGAGSSAALIVDGGQVVTSTNLVLGSNVAGGLASVLVQNGGLLESQALLMSNNLNSASSITNTGGIFQFATATPQIVPLVTHSIVVTNGTIAFRAVTNADVYANWSGVNHTLTNITFLGANTFRLNAASNTLANTQGYTFASGLGATNYVALEMINGSTAYRGGDITIGTGGSLLISNTTATFEGRVSNLTTVQVVNSTANFNTELLNQGALIANQSAITGLLSLSNSTVVVTGAAAQSWTANGNLMGGNVINIGAGGLTLSGILTNTGSLTKTGSGKLYLNATNTYTGGTIVNAGTLSVNGSILGNVAVNSGGALGGYGTIAGAVTINDGGTFSPGNSIGTNTVGSLTLTSGSILDWEFNTAPPYASDFAVVTNLDGLTINGGGFNLLQVGIPDPSTHFDTPGLYKLIEYDGTIAGTGVGALSVLNPTSGRAYNFSTTTSGGNQYVQLLISGVVGWDGGSSSDNNWTDPANWGGGVAPVAYDNLVFDGFNRLNNTNDFAANTHFAGITFTNTAGAFTLHGNAINLVGNIVNQSPNDQTLDMSLVLDTLSPTVNAASGNIILAGNISESGGSYGLTKTGSKTLILSGTDTYSGSTLVQAGTLLVNGTLGSGAGVFVNAGAALGGTGIVSEAVTLQSGATLAPGSGLGAGGLTFTSSLTLSNNFAYQWDLGTTSTDRLDVAALTLAGGFSTWTLELGTEGQPATNFFGINATNNVFVLMQATSGSLPVALTNNFVLQPGIWMTNQDTLVYFNSGHTQLLLTGVYLIPEPNVLILWLAGALTLLAARRRRKRCRRTA